MKSFRNLIVETDLILRARQKSFRTQFAIFKVDEDASRFISKTVKAKHPFFVKIIVA